MRLLGPGDPDPVVARHFGAGSGFLLVCDHAGRAVPKRLARLGLEDVVFDTHIAWDIGALGLAETLGIRLRAPLISQVYSRLVIDCNRAPGQAGSIAAISDGVPIPGNQGLAQAHRDARVEEIHAPYHARIAAEMETLVGARRPPLLVCVHSFTPVMQGIARPWHVGVLHGGASPACDALLRLLRAEPDLVVGDNQPYAMDGTDYTAPRHAWDRGLDVVELEVRQDLIEREAGQARFSDLLARLLPMCL